MSFGASIHHNAMSLRIALVLHANLSAHSTISPGVIPARTSALLSIRSIQTSPLVYVGMRHRLTTLSLSDVGTSTTIVVITPSILIMSNAYLSPALMLCQDHPPQC